jgi:hypothetical protein
MKVIKNAKTEREVLSSVCKSADSKDIKKSIKEKAEACVVHLCGCE